MALQPNSLLSLSQLASIKLGEQYKNYKVASCIQTLHINRWQITKITTWKSLLVVDLQEVWSFLSKNDWSELFHELTKDAIKNSEDRLKMQFKVQGRISNNSYLLTKTNESTEIIFSFRERMSFDQRWCVGVEHQV